MQTSESLVPSSLRSLLLSICFYRKMKYNKKSFHYLTTFSCLLDEGIAEMCKKFKTHNGLLRAEQDRAKNYCQIGCIGCPKDCSEKNNDNFHSNVLLRYS